MTMNAALKPTTVMLTLLAQILPARSPVLAILDTAATVSHVTTTTSALLKLMIAIPMRLVATLTVHSTVLVTQATAAME